MKNKVDITNLPSLDSLLEKWKRGKAKLQEECQAEVISDLAGFIKFTDKLHSVRVRAGTPSFNDGEPCRFGIYQIYLNGLSPDHFDDNEGDSDFNHSQGWPEEDFLEETILIVELVPECNYKRTVYCPAFDRVDTAIYQMKTLLESCNDYGLELDIWEEPDGNVYWTLCDWDPGY